MTELAEMDTVQEVDLERISPEAGRALLRIGGIIAADDALEALARNFGPHALALNLLGSYLHHHPGDGLEAVATIPDLEEYREKDERHAWNVLAAFVTFFGDGPEVELLRVLGLFDRPAKKGEVQAVRQGVPGHTAPVPGLTEHLAGLSDDEWHTLLIRLRDLRLLMKRSQHAPDVLDAHPLVREYFGARLQQRFPEAWREGHNRLYEYLKEKTTPRPDNLAGMTALSQAVAHGCQADRHQEALDEVYRRRMHREDALGDGTSYNQYNLGAISGDLAAVSCFFDRKIPDQPWHQPVAGLTPKDKGFVLNEAGWDLRSLGRLAEGVQVMQRALEVRSDAEDWIGSAGSAANLSVIHLQLGKLVRGLEYAEEGVKLAETAKSCGNISGPWGPMYSYNRAFLGEALHKAGRMEDAETAFRAAEAIQKEWDSDHPLLYQSLAGFLYCDFLLDQGKYQDVKTRASRTLEWNTEKERLRDIALDYLSLGRAHLLTGNLSEATKQIDHAVDGLRQARQQDHLLLGLLARAALRRVQKKYREAWADVEEAMEIAERGSMQLFQADGLLESARLHWEEGDAEQAQTCLEKAKKMIDAMGYHRRDPEVEALERVLNEGAEEK